mgnify:FL=1|jgi:hypothetical protein
MMESLCGVMGMEIYNSKQEIGCRILLILVCTQKKMRAETLTIYDYFSVHIDDIYSDKLCLHPSNPNHSSELLVRNLMVRNALSFLVSKGLVQIELSEFGIRFYADKFSENISHMLDCNYSRKYVEYVRCVDEYFGKRTEYEIHKYVEKNMKNWKSDLERGEKI